MNIYEQSRIERMSHYEREAKLNISEETIHEMTARTSFFFVVDYNVGQAEVQKTVMVEVLLIGLHLILIAAPIIYINYVATAWESGYKAYYCENVVAQGVCYGKPEIISQLLNLGVLFLTLVSVSELSTYYLNLPYSLPARILRHVFYGTFAFFLGVATWMVLLNATWIFLGVLQKPTLLAPYAMAAVCMVGVLAAYYGKLMRFRQVIRRCLLTCSFSLLVTF